MLGKKKILFIDGDEGVRKSIYMYFQSQGHDIRTIENATQALSVLQKYKFDIIFCEESLPDMNGLRFFNTITDRYLGSKRVLISIYRKNTYYDQMRNHSIDSVLTKPFTSESIKAILGNLNKNERL